MAKYYADKNVSKLYAISVSVYVTQNQFLSNVARKKLFQAASITQKNALVTSFCHRSDIVRGKLLYNSWSASVSFNPELNIRFMMGTVGILYLIFGHKTG